MRLILMALGLALALATMLMCAAVPVALTNAAHRDSARTPVVSAAGTGPHIDSDARQIATKPWHAIVIAGDLSRIPTPPGLSKWPEPGHSVVSPALKHALAVEPLAGFQLGTVDESTITSAGLVSPAEMYSYTRVASTVNPQSLLGFGGGVESTVLPSNTGLMYASLTLLSVVPAVLFTSICLRFSARSRQDRYARLVKLGVSELRCGRIFAFEMTAVSALAIVLAFCLFTLAEPTFGAHGWLGVAWWPSQGTLPWGVYAVGSVLVMIAIHRGSVTGMYRSLTNERMPRRTSAFLNHVKFGLGALLLLGSMGFLLVCVTALSTKAPTYHADESFIVYSLAAALTGVVGVILLNRHFIVGLSSVAERMPRATALKIGTRLALHHAPRVTKLTATIACALAATSFAGGMLTIFAKDASNDAGWQTISITADMTLEQRKAVMAIDTAFIAATYQAPDFQNYQTYNCPEVGKAEPITVAQCKNVPQSGATYAASVTDLPVIMLDGSTQTLVVPRANSQLVSASVGLKLPLDQGSIILGARDLVFDINVNTSDARLAQTMAKIHDIAPEVRLSYGVKYESGYNDLNAGAGSVIGGSILGFVVLCFATLFILIEVRWEMARSIASQQAMGIPARVLRRAAAYQMVVPLILPGALALCVGTLAAVLNQAVFAVAFMDATGVALAPTLALVGSLLALGTCGYAMGAPKFDRSLLATDS